jgi:hypothetical protein
MDEHEHPNLPLDADEARGAQRPPTTAPSVEPARAAWPIVLGVIGVIYASLGLLGGCCSVAWPAIMPAYISFMRDLAKNSPTMSQADVDALINSMPPAGWSILGGVIGLALAILLMTGSIKLLKRQASGVRLCTTWSVISLIWSPIGMAVAFYYQTGMLKDLDNPGVIGGIVGGVIGLVVNLALPVLMLVWFRRAASQVEIARWSTTEPAGR